MRPLDPQLTPLERISLSVIMLGVVLFFVGCHKNVPNPSQGTAKTDSTKSDLTPKPPDKLDAARRLLQENKAAEAAEIAYQELLVDPDNGAAKLIACEAEAAQNNHEVAASLAREINVRSAHGKQAVEIRWQQLAKLGKRSEAADVLLEGLVARPEMTIWRHQAWGILNQVGRRHDASKQADLLCRNGNASIPELVSLLGRDSSFPLELPANSVPQKHFVPGLGLSKWYFSQRKYRRAIQELEAEKNQGFSSPAACAFYGRLLAETQNYESIPAWFGACDSSTEEFSDYWAALGTYFFDQRKFEASARTLMEAAVRDPTDNVTVHRLARVFDALGRTEDAEQFRRRAVQIAQTQQDALKLSDPSAMDPEVRKTLPRKLLELARPFEALGWTLANLPRESAGARVSIRGQIAALSRDPEAINLASEMSLVEIDPNQFNAVAEMKELKRAAPKVVSRTPSDSKILAVPKLVNVAKEVGLAFQWYQDESINLASIPLHEMMGGGIAVIDFDLDGWPDIYLGQGSGDPPTDKCTRTNILFRNLGDQSNSEERFDSVTEPSNTTDYNYSTGIAAGDVNQDGFADLYLGSLGRNRLLINNGDGTFRDATESMGRITDQFTSSVAIADLNADGIPDLFEAVYVEMKGGFKLPDVGPDGREVQPSPHNFYAESDRWFQADKSGGFQARSISSEVAKPSTSLGVVVTDFNSDGKNEVFVGNDARPNHFLLQTGENTFRNAADALGLANGFSGYANACMGIATGDFDRNGRMDLHISNFIDESANHYLQGKGGGFTDYASRDGLEEPTLPNVGFGAKGIDIDRNGWLDLIVCNGHVFDRREQHNEPFQMHPQMLMNQGARFSQQSVTDPSGYWSKPNLGRSMALIDFDRSGTLDVLVGHIDQELALLQNQTSSPGNWVQFELIGTNSERDAIGAQVDVVCGDQKYTQWATAGDGYLASDEKVVEFGIGSAKSIDSVQVTWPAGSVHSYTGITPNGRFLLLERGGRPFKRQ